MPEKYNYTRKIEYVADFVGANVPRDWLRVSIVNAEDPLDVSASVVSVVPESTKGVYGDSETVPKDGEKTESLSATGATMLKGAVSRTKTFDVVVEWQTPEGTVVHKQTVVSGASGSATFSVDPAPSSHAVVKVVDKASTKKKASYAIEMV